MAYHGNAAYQLDVYGQAQAIPSRRPLSVHEGGGLDARARSERSARVAPLVGVVVALTLALAIVGALRVAITAQTVRLLGEVSIAESTVAQARDTRTELQVERSTLSNADRIQRIATENYGMVYASDVDTIHISTAAAADSNAEDAQMPEEGADAANAL